MSRRARALLLVTRGRFHARRVPAGAAKAFIEFALLSAARGGILEHDIVPYAN